MEQHEDRYKITSASWNKVAQKYQEKFMDLDLYNDSYDRFCELIKEKGNLLEIGCGPGNITRYFFAKRPDLKIEAIDVAPAMVALAKNNVPQADFKVMDCRDISSISHRFDGIVCGFCLPYLSREDATQLICDCSGLLNTGGFLYLSCIDGDYGRSGYETGSSGDGMYVYYHEEAYLAEQLKKNNFEIITLMRKDFGNSSHSSSLHLILLAQKKQ